MTLMTSLMWNIIASLLFIVAVHRGNVSSVVAEPDGRNVTQYRYIQYLMHAPKITVAPTDKKVMENGPVTLYCRASGHPPPDIFWRRAGRRITGNHERYTVVTVQQGGAAVLRIEPAKPRRDDSVFECVAENGVGDPATASANVEVYPEEREPAGYPRIVESPTLKAVEKDRNTVMLCSASGHPEPTVSWLKDYVPVDLTDSRFKVLPTGKRLRCSLLHFLF